MNASTSTLDPDLGLDNALATVASICAESGWPFTARSDDCMVKLEVKREGPPFCARIERAADGGLRARVDLTASAQELSDALDLEEVTETARQSPACRQAAEAIFAQVSKRIRGVRGVLRESPAWAGFEVQLPANSSGEQMADALAALSIACLFAGPEIQLLLSDPFIAESCLAQLSAAGVLTGGG